MQAKLFHYNDSGKMRSRLLSVFKVSDSLKGSKKKIHFYSQMMNEKRRILLRYGRCGPWKGPLPQLGIVKVRSLN